MSLFTLRISDEEHYGPVDASTLRTWAHEGRIERTHLIYDHALAKWLEAPEVEQIADYFTPEFTGPLLTSDPLLDTIVIPPATPANIQKTSQVTKEMIRVVTSRFPQQNIPPQKPPTVLQRISQLLVKKFLRKKSGPKKKHSRKSK
jgi:hypothetical protein